MRSRVPRWSCLALLAIAGAPDNSSAQRLNGRAPALDPTSTTTPGDGALTRIGAAPVPDREDFERDPRIAGLLSFLLPGAGSAYAGNFNGGAAFLVNGTTLTLPYLCFDACDNHRQLAHMSAVYYLNHLPEHTYDVAFLVVDAWSILTAVRDANAKNRELALRPGRVVGPLYFEPALIPLASHVFDVPSRLAPRSSGFQLGSIAF